MAKEIENEQGGSDDWLLKLPSEAATIGTGVTGLFNIIFFLW